jgi:hypothetical protein
MLGGVRNEDDEKVVDNLRELANDLELEEDVDFKFIPNAPMDILSDLLTVNIFKNSHINNFFRSQCLEYIL